MGLLAIEQGLKPSAWVSMPKILGDRGLTSAINARLINVTPTPKDKQIQPASLDVKIGEVRVYDYEAQIRTNQQMAKLDLRDIILDRDIPTTEFAKVYPDESSVPIKIPSVAFAEIFLHEDLQFDTNDYSLEADLRSSRGRLGLTLQSKSIQVENGRRYLQILNHNPNDIILYGQSRFAQVFFYPKHNNIPNDGHIIVDPIEVKRISEQICDTNKIKTYGHYILFSVGDHIFKTNKIGTIDTKNMPNKNELYTKYDTSSPVVCQPDDAIIVQLTPKLKLPPNIGVKLLNNIPLSQISGSFDASALWGIIEGSTANAGWVDPGYNGNITGHPFYFKGETILKKGDTVGVGLIYQYNNPVLRPYGSEFLDSHYQNTTGEVSKN